MSKEENIRLFLALTIMGIGVRTPWDTVYANHTINSTENIIAEEGTDSSKHWAFDNAGDFFYDDNAFSWYSERETIFAVKGMDINLQPVKEKVVEYKRETIVAILDTGVDIEHPALVHGIWNNEDEIAEDGIDNDENGYIDDINGWNFYKNSNVLYNSRSSTEDAHGTHCAGIIIGYNEENNWSGIAGELSQIKIMPIKVLGGIDGTGTFRDLIEGIRYAEKNGAVICSLSIGTDIWNEELYQVMKESKMLFIVAAGNGGSSTHGKGESLEGRPMYPACYDLENMIVVANVKCDGTLHYSSFYGKNYVDVAAPGTRIYSTSTIKEGYEMMTGTSMAVPVVSGIASLVYSSQEEEDILYTKEAILNSCKKIDVLSELVGTGGIPDIEAAMEYSGKSSEEEIVPDQEETKEEEVTSDQEETKNQEDNIFSSDDIGSTEQTDGMDENPQISLPPVIREDFPSKMDEPAILDGERKELEKVGRKITLDNSVYLVTKSSRKAREVKMIEVKDGTRNLRIPGTIEIKGYKYKVTALAHRVAAGNKKLTKVIIGRNIKNIGRSAFKKCKSLKSVVISPSVTRIGKQAFSGASNLKKVVLQGNRKVKLGRNVFENISKKAVFTVAKKNFSYYKKILKIAKISKTAKIKKRSNGEN